mgnify:CR=1 FL=1|tara:strand:+ start:67 stop:363 length:297 start_codon:yes stop_codon:yes gene_type:complete
MATYERTLVQYENKFAERCEMCNKPSSYLERKIEWAYTENIKLKRKNHRLMMNMPKANEPDDYILIKYCPICADKRKGNWFKVQNGEYHHLEDQKSGD